MKRCLACLLGACALGWSALGHGASLELFSPQGEAKGVRQARARFSAPMVALGDPRLPEPFAVDCNVPGSGRWVDTRNWAYDFERDLPAGVRCTFTLVPGLKTLAGEPVDAAGPFGFTTGGPAVVETLPHEGATVDEEQAFILGLDAQASPQSIAANAYCDVQGVPERIPVQVLAGEERKAVLEARKDFVGRWLRLWFKDGRSMLLSDRGPAAGAKPLQSADPDKLPIAVLRCQRRLPNDAPLRLVWGKGIESESGVPTSQDQAIAWRVRSRFEARFTCERVNAEAQCLPILPMRLSFTAPVPRAAAAKIVLKPAMGAAVAATLPDPKSGGDFVDEVTFPGPFPERAQMTLEVPADLVDDAGRKLANARRFPLQVRTDEYPPLAKFAARFGIIELNGDGMLPVTLRNLEALVEARSVKIGKQEDAGAQLSDKADLAINWLRKQLDTAKGQEGENIPGLYSRVADGDVMAIVRWLRRLREYESDRMRYDDKKQDNVAEYRAGEKTIFTDQDKARRMTVPKPQGARAFEVVGIPLRKPGFYVVELASPRLGAALLGGRNRPYYVQAGALVTNLSVHLKWGRESSLVWVTALDTGRPVAKAQVAVQDCAGKVYYRGETDAQGRARIGALVPEKERLPGCLAEWDRQLLASARLGDDLGVVFSDWNEGISRWRFNLRSAGPQGSIVAATVLDRNLLRAGETVSMKHYYRRHTTRGFSYVPVDQLPKKIVIQHLGSDERYELPVTWDGRDSAESTWAIPPGAKKGTYQVTMTDTLDALPGRPGSARISGSFRVEEFRVPLMQAQIGVPKAAQVRPQALDLDLSLRYLAGGGAAGAPVKVRAVVRPKPVGFPGYDGFSFANGRVQEGVEKDAAQGWTLEEFELEGDEEGEAQPAAGIGAHALKSQSVDLDATGSGHVKLGGLPLSDQPQELAAEMEYLDPNGETLSAATRVALWPSRLLLGVKPDAWAASSEELKFQVVALDLAGRPLKGRKVKAELYLRQPYAHRKRLVGGFYGYESGAEIRKLPVGCEGVSDARGRVFCAVKPGVSGNVFLVAQARDAGGNVAYANASAWIAGKEDWWFDASNDDRMDVVPERKRYEPGQSAQLQVRMPFRQATALVTVEREGVIDSFVQPLSGASPVIKLPVKANYAPNVFVSVLAVRGRVEDVKPTALIDLGKPAFKMGVAEISVGWRAHELNVQVKPERDVFRVRERARVALRVTQRLGGKPVPGAEVAIAAVDEGLLDLLPNDSWKLLDTMMRPRGIDVDTATASMQVVGKRHFGRKALPAGGGGGRESARELFDTLLYWKARVPLDAKGNASVDIPLNDSLTSFRIVAVADAGTGAFGTGQASIRTSQDLQLLSGLPPVVREGDRFDARFTVRNASARAMTVEVAPKLLGQALEAQRLLLAAGEARDAVWQVDAPVNASRLEWEVAADELTENGPVRGDRLRLAQRVAESVPVRTLQATLVQLDAALSLPPVARPQDALPGRGGVRVAVAAQLGDGLTGVRDWMQHYPYSCLEQRVSQAVALRDAARWKRVMDDLPSYLDRDGLAKYFALERLGSDTLTAYVLSLADEAGWAVPEDAKSRMSAALRGFVEGRVVRDSALPTADLAIRKVAALEALSRAGPLEPGLLSTIPVEPDLWPTSAVLDWTATLRRSQFPERDKWLAQAQQILRARLNFQGSTMGFSTERSDYLWWLMSSVDANANRVLLAFVDDDGWREDVPRLARGALGRQQRGHWSTTVANAWGVLAMEKFSARFEKEPVSGSTTVAVPGEQSVLDWARNPKGGMLDLPWPAGGGLALTQQGSGKPWVSVQARAAVPLAAPLSSGFRIVRTVTPVEARVPDKVSRGDTLRVHLEIEAQSDMTWVVVDDPVPSGATILGRGMSGESSILGRGERNRGFVWPAFEERGLESFRAYYRFVPKGSWSVEYTLRLNNPGRFVLPPTRVEAMYAPEMFGMLPNDAVTVEP
ncbi:MAG TPA: MG2 domain-containing protein [Burkholderiales bacterium]|nr:MG2 domain-containing protein [Burkholderiales bacterium]